VPGTTPAQAAQADPSRDDQKNPRQQEYEPDHRVMAGKRKNANAQPDDKHQEPEELSFATIAHGKNVAMKSC